MKGKHHTEVRQVDWWPKDDDNVLVVDDETTEKCQPKIRADLDKEIEKELVDLTKQWIRNRIGPGRWRTKTFGEAFDYKPMMREILEKYYLLNDLDCTLEELFGQEDPLYTQAAMELDGESFKKAELERVDKSHVKCPRCNYTWTKRTKDPRECPNCGTRFFYDYWQK